MTSAQQDVQLHDFSNIFSLKGKVAVVTGGSRGLGLHAASGLLQAGCSKVFITSRETDDYDAAAAALNALPNKSPGAQAYAIPADSSKLSEINRLVQEVSKHTDHVDILLANAGTTWGSKFEETDEKNAWDKVMDLNLKGTFFTIQKFTPLLTKAATTQDPSRVIAMGSVAGIVTGETGETNAWSYAASKAAVLHLVRYLAVELGPRHVLVNGIAPGVMVTKMTRALMGGAAGEEALAKKHPNGRMGKPEDIAAAVVYLSSRAGGHINGHTIVVDGGKIHARNNL